MWITAFINALTFLGEKIEMLVMPKKLSLVFHKENNPFCVYLSYLFSVTWVLTTFPGIAPRFVLWNTCSQTNVPFFSIFVVLFDGFLWMHNWIEPPEQVLSSQRATVNKILSYSSLSKEWFLWKEKLPKIMWVQSWEDTASGWGLASFPQGDLQWQSTFWWCWSPGCCRTRK